MRSLGPLPCLLITALATAGCEHDPYQMISLGDGGLPDLETPDSYICTPTNDGVEACDGLDNDCDGQIDEDFNRQTDPDNCGQCGNSCRKPGALTVCELGKCKYLGCAPGFIDLDKDPQTGCEYECTASGPEVCDGQDNDCNGEIDETFNLDVDVDNCGACGNACQLAHATPKCEGGVCKIQQCEQGYINKDGDHTNGCEEPCTITNGGVELCDGIDNDCNGVVDDPGGVPIDFTSDPLNCGACGVVCGLPNADADCQASKCILVQCSGSYVNADGNPDNGCECLPEGVEVCDGKDNDCNGQVDDGLTNLGPCGSSTGECKPGILVCQGGLPTCVGATPPAPEICDGKDNDCNGVPDDNLPPLGVCGSSVGECKKGVLECQLGQPVCVGNYDGSPEVCDGKDNDCNGQVDDNLGPLGPCGSDVGDCTQGTYDCQNGVPVCVGSYNGSPEVCDGKDNDCSGVADDNLPASLGICGIATGECKQGTLQCVNGQPECTGHVPPEPEVCDGKDNDCNGQVDDNVPGFPGTCGTDAGECQAGTLVCQAGQPTCLGAVGPTPEMCDGKDNDCNGQLDPAACVFPGSGREVRLDEPGVSNLGEHNSTQLAIAGSGDRILAVWLDRPNGRGDIFGNLSTDGGVSWESSDIAIADESRSKVEPQVAFGGPSASSWRAYVVYEHFTDNGRRDVYLRRSTDSGLTWSSRVRLDSLDRDSLYVRLAVLPGPTDSNHDVVTVCWGEIRTSGSLDPNIRCNISLNSGEDFEGNVRVNATPDNAIVPEIAVSATHLHVAWQQGTDIRAARAPLAGSLSFSDEAVLNAEPGQDHRIAATPDGSDVVVVWEDLRDPLINIRANRSSDAGQIWLADGVRVDKDVVNGDSTSPWVAIGPAGRVHVAWTDTSRGKQDIYTNFSDDGGATWGVVARRVNADTAGTSTSLRPVIASAPAGQNVYVAWEELRNGQYRDIYFSVSLDRGETWNIPDYRINETPAGAADARGPLLWPSSGRVAVLWIDNRTESGGSIVTGDDADIYCSYVD